VTAAAHLDPARPTLSQLTRVFLRIGLLSFGGPAAQIALMHRELVEERPWLSEQDYLRALSFCMLLPGPEAMQLAAFAGWRLQGLAGGLIAGGLFILPGALVIFALAFVYSAVIDMEWVQALFLGVKATVVVIVSRPSSAWPGAPSSAPPTGCSPAWPSSPCSSSPSPSRWWSCRRPLGRRHRPDRPGRARAPVPLPLARPPRHPRHRPGPLVVPVALAALAGQGFLTDLGLFFSKLAVVTFGGAYAVLGYMAQEVVSAYRWVSTPQLMDALGLAETTPGPLILVTVFVSIVAGLNQGSTGLALLGGLMTLWVTFVPCFLWIFAGAPLVDWIAGRPRLQSALSAITAAVVGVILNLSVWFALHVLFGEVRDIEAGPLTTVLPVWTTLQPVALALSLVAAWLLLVRHASMLLTLAAMAALAGLLHLLGLL
jgi:chromate transporter